MLWHVPLLRVRQRQCAGTNQKKKAPIRLHVVRYAHGKWARLDVIFEKKKPFG
jgi:hypothetical protein